MGYTVKDVKAIIENLDDDTPLFGFILGPNDVEIYTKFGQERTVAECDADDKDYMNPNQDEWAKVVEVADKFALRNCLWDNQWEIMNDAISMAFTEEGEED